MNKLQGFYEMERMGIPVVPWKPFTGNEALDPELLWSVRVAVQSGYDFNLPRAIGVTADQALVKGRKFLAKLSPQDLVVYYPYFIALKSGILEIQADQTIIEAVNQDLWNLTTLGKKDVTLMINRQNGTVTCHGQADFLTEAEIDELLYYAQKIRRSHRQYIYAQNSLILEWHYALHTNVHGDSIGEKFLVFTECKSIGDAE
ncbi:MAG: hypothetical protein ABRQ23_10210 [Syntrophomonadaceae bacterium]